MGAGNNGTIVLPTNFLGGNGSITSIASTGGIILEGSLSGIILSNSNAMGLLRLDTIQTNRGIIQLGSGWDTAFGSTLTDNWNGKLISTGASISALSLTGGTFAALLSNASPQTYGASEGGTLVLPAAWNTPFTNAGNIIITDGGTIIDNNAHTRWARNSNHRAHAFR